MVMGLQIPDMAEKPLRCPICGDVASARLQLDKHLLTEHPLTERIECLLDTAERERDARRLADPTATATAEIETD
jgi:hypothetical protein